MSSIANVLHKYLIAMVLLVAPVLAFGQGGNINRQVIAPTVANNGTGQPASFASVRVCPSTASGFPCSPLSPNVFADQALTQPLPSAFAADTNGNYDVFVPTGTYLVQESNAVGAGYTFQYSWLWFVNGTATISSVSLSLPASLFSVSGSPCTTVCALSAGLINQSANSVFGNCTASSSIPNFCLLTANMIPGTLNSTTINGTLGVTGASTLSGGGTLTGTFAGNPTFSGTPSFTGNLSVNAGTTPTQFQVFGDSISYGVGATTPDLDWVSQTAELKGWTVVDNGVSGSWIADQADQFFTYAVPLNAITLLLTSVNDMRGVNTNGTQQALFQSQLLDELAWLGTTDASKVKAQGGSVVYGGSWNIPSAGAGAWPNTLCKNTTTVGATATFATSGTVLYFGGLQQQANNSTFTIAIDGVGQGTFNSISTYPTTGGFTRSFYPYGIRFSGLSSGSHSVLVTSSAGTDGSDPAYVCWVGTKNGAGPIIYNGNTLKLTAAGYASGGGSDTAVGQFNTIISNQDAVLVGDGLAITYVDASSVYTPNTMTIADGIHPNNLGHATIAGKFLSTVTQPNSVVNAYIVGNAPAPSGNIRLPYLGSIRWANSTSSGLYAQIQPVNWDSQNACTFACPGGLTGMLLNVDWLSTGYRNAYTPGQGMLFNPLNAITYIRAAGGGTVNIENVNAQGVPLLGTRFLNHDNTLKGLITDGTDTLSVYLQTATSGKVLFQDQTGAPEGSFSTVAAVFPGSVTASSGLLVGTSVAADGSGLKHKRFGATCSTTNVAGNICTTTEAWTTAFADANYTVTCSGIGPTGTPSLGINATPVAASVTISVTAITAIVSSYAAVDCIAMHD